MQAYQVMMETAIKEAQKEPKVSDLAQKLQPIREAWQERPVTDEYFALQIDTLRLHVRRMIYTTNWIEGLNRNIRKVTKRVAAFPSTDSLLNLGLSINFKKGATRDISQHSISMSDHFILTHAPPLSQPQTQ